MKKKQHKSVQQMAGTARNDFLTNIMIISIKLTNLKQLILFQFNVVKSQSKVKVTESNKIWHIFLELKATNQ